jgi:tetratricopeptide (TPR) repeat protein
MIAALRDPHRRRPAMRDLVVAVAAIVALDRLLASQPGGAGLWSLARSMLATATGDQGNGAGPSYLFSWRHLRDFVNEQFLIGPWALALFLAALLVTWRRRALGKPSRGTGETVSPAVAFVSVAAAAVAVASWIAADPALGYPRDWDAFAPSGVAFVVAGIALLSRAIPEPWLLRRVLATLVVTSLLHLCAWVALNHSEARAMERFATLPLGMGRTELVIGNWYRRQGAPEEAERWLLAAVEAAPDNSNAWALLGQLAADRHDLRAVAAAYEKAVALRPDKSLYRQNLARAYEYDGRYRDALAQYARLAQSDPGFLENWIRWARMALACGDTAQARAVVARARPALEQFARERPAGPLWAEVRELLALPTRGPRAGPRSAPLRFVGGDPGVDLVGGAPLSPLQEARSSSGAALVVNRATRPGLRGPCLTLASWRA